MRHWTPILVLLLAAVGSALIHVTLTKQYENWVTAPGEITRVELYMGHRKLGSGKSQRIFYRYTVDGVTYEGSELFSGCTSLTKVTIPDSVTEIDKTAFNDCKKIKATYKGKTYTYSKLDALYKAINGD